MAGDPVNSFCVFGLTVRQVLEEPEYQVNPRDLQCVELRAGRKAVAKAARGAGYSVATFDIQDDVVEQDLASWNGFRNAVATVMRLQPGGYLHQAPVCASFVWANSSKTKRTSKNPAGDLSYQPVVLGNIMAEVAAFNMLLCDARGDPA